MAMEDIKSIEKEVVFINKHKKTIRCALMAFLAGVLATTMLTKSNNLIIDGGAPLAPIILSTTTPTPPPPITQKVGAGERGWYCLTYFGGSVRDIFMKPLRIRVFNWETVGGMVPKELFEEDEEEGEVQGRTVEPFSTILVKYIMDAVSRCTEAINKMWTAVGITSVYSGRTIFSVVTINWGEDYESQKESRALNSYDDMIENLLDAK